MGRNRKLRVTKFDQERVDNEKKLQEVVIMLQEKNITADDLDTFKGLLAEKVLA